jgi:pimeloyl-ACP methyl ester carboxylesterase
MRALLNVLRVHPIDGVAFDADGTPRHIHFDSSMLAYVAYSASTVTTIYRELDAAIRAALRPVPDTRPLLRLAAENLVWGDAGDPVDFSEGLYDAVNCNDIPQPFDRLAPPSTRRAQYQAGLRQLQATDPDAFAPFTVREWVDQQWSIYDDCLLWPTPSHYVPPIPPGAVYPSTPTLVLVGDLDSLTSPLGSRIVADRFPNSTFVLVSNMIHVSALGDYGRCASDIVVRFVRTLSAGNTSCAKDYDEVHMTPNFPVRASEISGSPTRQAVAIAAGTVGDVIARWWDMSGYLGVGLRGGTFVTIGVTKDVGWRLRGVRWVEDVAVDGRIAWDRTTGATSADATFGGGAVPSFSLHLSWNDWEPNAQAHVTGTVGGQPVDLTLPAP